MEFSTTNFTVRSIELTDLGLVYLRGEEEGFLQVYKENDSLYVSNNMRLFVVDKYIPQRQTEIQITALSEIDVKGVKTFYTPLEPEELLNNLAAANARFEAIMTFLGEKVFKGCCPSTGGGGGFTPVQLQNSQGVNIYLVSTSTTPQSLNDILLTDDSGPLAPIPVPNSIVVDGLLSGVSSVSGITTLTVNASDIVYQRSVFRGQLTSYSLYDQGWQAANGAYDFAARTGPKQRLDFTHPEPFFNLAIDNEFGNRSRYTDSEGVPAPDLMGGFDVINWAVDRPDAVPYYAIDHLTGNGICLVKIGFNQDWVSALNTCETFVLGPYSDFRMFSPSEICDVINVSLTTPFYNTPNIFYRSDVFAVGSEAQIWLNETNPSNTTQARSLNLSGDISRQAKSTGTNFGTFALRTHYL